MKINILHLSDLHISVSSSKNPILHRGENITAAFNSIVQDAKNCFIVVLGDTSFLGHPREFSIALEFFSSLLKALETRLPNCDTKFLFTPGNHDCDFSNENTIRDLILKDITPDNIDEFITSKCTEVQEDLLSISQSYSEGIYYSRY